MLKERNAVILRGNHEARLANYQQYQGYNWALLHWIASQVDPEEAAALPIDFSCGPVLMTHIKPGSLE